MSVSVYATLWVLQFPKFGQYYLDCDWVTVVAQGVPGHVGGEGADPYESCLPSLSTSVAGGLRAGSAEEIQVEIETLAVIKGEADPRDTAEALEWAASNREELRARWREYSEESKHE